MFWALGDVLGMFWVRFEGHLGALGGSSVRLRSLLERLGAAWGMSWARIGKSNKKHARGTIEMTPLGDPT